MKLYLSVLAVLSVLALAPLLVAQGQGKGKGKAAQPPSPSIPLFSSSGDSNGSSPEAFLFMRTRRLPAAERPFKELPYTREHSGDIGCESALSGQRLERSLPL